jgi:hypothetical protein
MKSQNDIYHGDEHLTDKPQKYLVECSEIVYYEIEVEAMDQEEAEKKAYDTPIDKHTIVNSRSFQVDNIAEVEDEPNYNYTLGGQHD